QPLRVFAAVSGPAAELLALGEAERPRRPVLLLGAGALVSEPPLRDRRHLRGGPRQPGAGPEAPCGPTQARLLEGVGVRLRRRRLRGGRGLRRRNEQCATVLRLPHGGGPPLAQGHPVVLLL